MKILAMVTKREEGLVYYNEISAHDGSVMIDDHMSEDRFKSACQKDKDFGFKRITAKGVASLVAKAAKRTAKIEQLIEREQKLSCEVHSAMDSIAYNNSSESCGCSYADVRKHYATPKLKRLEREHTVTVNAINKIMQSYSERAWDNEFGHVWEYEGEEEC